MSLEDVQNTTQNVGGSSVDHTKNIFLHNLHLKYFIFKANNLTDSVKHSPEINQSGTMEGQRVQHAREIQ